MFEVDRLRTGLYNFFMEPDRPNEDTVDLRTKREREEDDRIDRLMSELAAIEPGVQVVIQRKQPTWCKGNLEKLTIGEEGLDLDYLIKTWGGHLLSLRIQDKNGQFKGIHNVELYSFPPRRHGKLLKAPNQFDDDEPQPNPQPQPMAAPREQSSITELMFQMFIQMSQQMQAQAASERETLRALLLNAQPQTPRNSIGETMAAFKAFTEMREMLSGDGGSGGDGDGFPGQIMDMVKMFMESKQHQQAPARLVPQRPSPAPVPNGQLVPPRGPQPKPEQLPSVTPIRSPQDLAAQIAALEPHQAAETLMHALGGMKPEKQEVALAAFGELFNEANNDFMYVEETADDDPDERGTESKAGT
jgi:hypothetical protein